MSNRQEFYVGERVRINAVFHSMHQELGFIKKINPDGLLYIELDKEWNEGDVTDLGNWGKEKHRIRVAPCFAVHEKQRGNLRFNNYLKQKVKCKEG